MNTFRVRLLGSAIILFTAGFGCAAPEGTSEPASAESNMESSTELPESSPLRQKVEEIGSRWLDENLMHGRASVYALKLRFEGAPDDAALKQAAMAVLLEKANEDEMELEAAFQETVEPLSDASTARAGRTVALDGFVFVDSAENIAPMVDDVRSVVALLGDASKVSMATIEGKGMVPWNEGSWRTTTFLFVNTETNESAAFFVREGWE